MTKYFPYTIFLSAGLWLLILLGSTPMSANAQQPASFLLGEDQFRGIQIYDVIQDNALNYWFATNEGIYLFNGVVYERIECAKAKSSSVFNFVKDASGTIYCHNLNNQVFCIRDKTCRLFYELSETEGSADISLCLTANGNLIVTSKQVMVLNPAGKVIQRNPGYNHYIGPPLTTKKGAIIYHFSFTDSLLVYQNGSFSYKRLSLSGKKFLPSGVFRFFYSGENCYAMKLKTKDLFSLNTATFSLTPLPTESILKRSESIRIYESSHGFWAAGTLPGVSYFDKKSHSSNGMFFDSYFISDVFEDAEGNILLSTFDKGILVIPDMKIPDVIGRFETDPVVSLYSDPEGDLILGTSQGKLLRYADNRLSTMYTSGKRPIEVINSYPGSNWYFFSDENIRAYHKKTGRIIDIELASLKDVAFVSAKELFLGTNRGVVHIKEVKDGQFERKNIRELMNRVHYLEYDPTCRLLYVSTAVGTIIRTHSGKIQHLLYQGKELYPTGIYVQNGAAYLSTRENGILVFKNGQFVRKIIPRINNKPVTVKKLVLYKNTIIAITASGFFQFDLKGKVIRSISSTYGFTSNRVVDFTFHRGKLWVSHTGGVQQINPEYHSPVNVIPLVRIDKIFVNDRQIRSANGQTFAPNERKFQFFFSASTLRNRETVKYHYRLLGNDTKWNTADFDARQITYSALAPGKYTLQIRMENQGEFSEIQTLSFYINAPVYTRWWFISLAILLLAGGIVFSYRWQVAIQRRKAERINELNASKLTAIQSQMNPHFIFNSLNSIQDLILKGDVEHSYSYITTFSNLVRRTLNYSEKDFIDFGQEMKLLELYLSLEKLRFKKDFDYFIHSNELQEDVMIPPLLIQPFVENALVHGLLHKEGEKRLVISFRLEEVLICTIEDNGIGREAARAIRQRQRADHESFSSKAIHRRFEILSHVFDGQFGYSYEDLMENGVATGTRVTLRIPVKGQF